MSAEADEIVELPRPDGAPRDGIGEEDNPIPPWWWWSFFATIVFAAFYTPYYILSDWSQETQWAAEVERHQARVAANAPPVQTTNPYHGDAAAIAEGRQVFDTICAACHKPDGSGLVGPSLVDPYWKYGADDVTLFETVTKGRPAGMPAWESQLGSEKIWKSLAYMATLSKSAEPGIGAPGVGPAAPGAPAAAPADPGSG
jgi:cytochrome c oxidase cbb3-type subunit 3